jgi:uncharacterized membrane protein YhaH (DUF805 family)
MDWGHLFFGFSGRINRAKFWIAVLVYAIVTIIVGVVSYLADESTAVQAIGGIVNLVVFISGLAVGVKRLHDRDKSGWYLLLFYIVPSVLVGIALAMTMTMEDATVVAGILDLIAFAISIWAFVELGCLRGTVGMNRFGPDPLGAAATPPPPPRPQG